MRLPTEVDEVLEKASRHPEGLGPLFEGHLESVAALYQVHPSQVEAVRQWARPSAELVLRQRPTSEQETPGPRSADELLAEALGRPGALEGLTEGPVEAAAVRFGVHPFAIDQARAALSLQGQQLPVAAGSPSLQGRSS